MTLEAGWAKGGDCKDHEQNEDAGGEASTGLGQNRTLNPAASMSPFSGLPYLPPTTVPEHQPLWEQLLPPFVPAPCSQENPLVLSALPGTPLVAGDGDRGPSGPGPFNIVFQVGTERWPAGPPKTQNVVLAQAPVTCSALGALRGGVGHPAPFLMPTSAPKTVVPASASENSQPQGGSWPPGLAPPGPPPLATPAPVASPVVAQPWPHQAGAEGSQATRHTRASTGGSCKHESVYENFRHWQRFKTLLRRHLPRMADVEALSCFLIPVLRTLSRREPTMSIKDGLWKGLHEWRHTSNFDRMIFHEMAEKFMEFEAIEKMEDPKVQMMAEFPCRPPAAPPRPDPPRPSAPEVAQQPVCTSRKTGPKSRPARPLAPKRQLPPQNKAPREIPPEAVQEYVDIMESLVRPGPSAPREPDGTWEEDGLQQQPEDRMDPDPGFLSYIDKLCSQRDFVTRVDTIIHPQFLDELLSPGPDIDILTLSKVFEQEEGLTQDQLLEKRLQSSTEKGGVRGPRNRAAPQLDSSDSMSAAFQGAERDGRGARGVGTEARPPQVTSQELPRGRATDAELLGPKDAATDSGCHGSPSLGATWPRTAFQDHRATSLSLGTRGPVSPNRASPAGGPRGTAVGCNEDDDDLSSLAFLLTSQHRLLPWGLSHSQGPGMDLLCPGGRAPQQRRGLHPSLRPATTSMEQAVLGGPSQVETAPCSEPALEASGGQGVALGLVGGSQPQKKRESSGPRKMKKKKRH